MGQILKKMKVFLMLSSMSKLFKERNKKKRERERKMQKLI